MNNLGRIRAPKTGDYLNFQGYHGVELSPALTAREKLQICLREPRPRRCGGLHDYPYPFSARRTTKGNSVLAEDGRAGGARAGGTREGENE